MDTMNVTSITFRGEAYTINRSNMAFIRLWGRFFARHRPVDVFDCFCVYEYTRDAGPKERQMAREALKKLRAWYPR